MGKWLKGYMTCLHLGTYPLPDGPSNAQSEIVLKHLRCSSHSPSKYRTMVHKDTDTTYTQELCCCNDLWPSKQETARQISILKVHTSILKLRINVFSEYINTKSKKGILSTINTERLDLHLAINGVPDEISKSEQKAAV